MQMLQNKLQLNVLHVIDVSHDVASALWSELRWNVCKTIIRESEAKNAQYKHDTVARVTPHSDTDIRSRSITSRSR